MAQIMNRNYIGIVTTRAHFRVEDTLTINLKIEILIESLQKNRNFQNFDDRASSKISNLRIFRTSSIPYFRRHSLCHIGYEIWFRGFGSLTVMS